MAKHTFPKESVNEHARQNRQREYQSITDPMFMKAQRNEIPMQDWLDAVEKIKTKYPYVTEDLVIDDEL